jgi:hypothetical protein
MAEDTLGDHAASDRAGELVGAIRMMDGVIERAVSQRKATSGESQIVVREWIAGIQRKREWAGNPLRCGGAAPKEME